MRKTIVAKKMMKVLSCLVVIAVLMSAVTVLAQDSLDSSGVVSDNSIFSSVMVSREYIATLGLVNEFPFNYQGKSVVDEIKLNSDEINALAYVQKHAKEQKISPALLMAIIKQESNFNPNAIGDGGLAIGYMQLHWAAAYDAGYRSARGDSKNYAEEDWPTDGFGPDINIKYGCSYLKICYDKHRDNPVYGNSLKNAISAYNLGWPHGPDKSNEYSYVNPIIKYYGNYRDNYAQKSLLNVPFKAQVPPGIWSETRNCGQAATLMVFCYYKGTTPTEQEIKAIDDWLYKKYGDPVRDYNGDYTTTTKLEALAREYAGFPNSYKASGWDLNRLKQEINEGHPIVVAVTASYLSNRGYSYSGEHFVIAKGYTDTHIVCNDPGTSKGCDKYYVNSEFSKALNSQSGSVMVVLSTDSSRPTSPQDHSLVRYSDDPEQKVYWLQNGKLYWVTDWSIINDMSSLPGWSTVNMLPSDVFNPDNYQKGPRFITTGSESNGLLIQKSGEATFYFVKDGERNPFSSWEAFAQRKYDPADVIAVTDAILNRFGIGTWINQEPFTIDLFLNKATFTTGETKQTKVTQTSGRFYTVKTYYQVTKLDGIKRYAYYPNPNFQPTDPFSFSDTKRPLYEGTWISELKTWHFDTYTFTGSEPEGQWSWELWYENANNPGVKIASDTVTYTFTRSRQQEQNADLNCDGKVDSSDSGILMSYWGTDGSGATSCRSPDINQDGIVDSLDLSILKSQWTQPNETPVARITMTSGSESAYEDKVLELSVPAGGTANIHLSASRSSDPDGTISSYQWLVNGQPAGNKCDFDSDDLNEGTYDIFLTVTDNKGAEDSVGATIIITATNKPSHLDQPTQDYNRQAAVTYAKDYARKACSCGNYYGSTHPPEGSGTQLTKSGGDCAHFVSHCLAAGGLSNKGWCKDGYTDGQMCKRGARGWCEGGARDYIITAHEMRDWFTDTSIATKVSTVDQLEPGDVITYGSPPSHAVLYIGDHKVASHSAWGIFSCTHFGTPREYWHINVGSLPQGDSSDGGTPLVSIAKTIRSDSDNIIDLTTSDPIDGSRDVIFNITLTNTGTVDARVTVEDDLANGDYYIADPTGPLPLTDVTVPAGGSYPWEYRARYQGSATADGTPVTNTARIIWIHNYYDKVRGKDYGGHGAVTSSQTAYIHNPPSQPSQGLSADINCDGKVDSSDSGILMRYWGTDGSGATSCRSPDVNQDGIVDSLDLNILKSQWTQPNETPVARITMTSGSETAHEDDVLELTVPSGETANIHFSASRSSDPDGTISNYQWLINGQPAGNKCDFDSDDLSEGAYDIFLTVTDNEGAEDSVGASIIITSEITAENEPPIARITMTSGSETAYEDEVLELTVPSGGTANVHFSASRSTDPDGLISSYQWLINGQPAGNKCDSDSDDLSEGTYDIFLTVIDNEGAEDSVGASIIITATVENEPPTAGITMTSGSETAYENQVLELTVPSGGTAKVYFYADRSSDPDGSISSYKWYIGGSYVSDSRDFRHDLGEGTHQIYLTVKDNKDAEGSVGATIKITANNPPVARITMQSGSKTAYENQVLELTVPTGGAAKIDFSASRSSDPDGSITDYQWYIGGSPVKDVRDFSYTLGEGTHDIFLTVTDNKGAEGSVGASVKITATNNPPTARITMQSGSKTAYEDQVLELTVPTGGAAKIDFSASRSSDSDGSIKSYQWYIGGSPVRDVRDFYYYLGEGTHQIYLTVKDNKDAEGSVGATVKVTANKPPVARITMKSGSKTAYENQVLELTVPTGGAAKIDFSASRSSDPDGSITGYQWYIGGTPVKDVQDFYYYLGEGTHQIYLAVTDNKGAEGLVGATVKITANKPPVARITMKSGSKTAYENQVLELTVPTGGAAKIDFSASRSSDPDGTIKSYQWYIGGSPVKDVRDFYYYLGEGTHQIYLAVTDNKGAEGLVGATVKITANKPPVARITMKSGSKTAYENQVLELTVPTGGAAKIDFSASRSSDSDGSITGYQWYIGGSPVKDVRDFYYYLGEGTHQIYLAVTDNKGAEGLVGATVKITANKPPVARITMKSGSKTAYENQVLELTVPTGGAAKIDFSASRSSDSDGSITGYQWYIGGSPVKDVRDFYYYLGEGTHQIYLAVTDNKGAEGLVGATVKITANKPPVARITMKSGSKTAYENQVLELTVPTGGAAKIDFSASRSSDSDGSIKSYQWYIGGSPVKDVRDFYYYLGEGTHDIFLTVKDNNDATGSVGATVKITR